MARRALYPGVQAAQAAAPPVARPGPGGVDWSQVAADADAAQTLRPGLSLGQKIQRLGLLKGGARRRLLRGLPLPAAARVRDRAQDYQPFWASTVRSGMKNFTGHGEGPASAGCLQHAGDHDLQ